MDAGIIASSLIQKLQDESKFKKHIEILESFKQCLRHPDNQSFLVNSVSEQKIARLLQAVFSVDDAVDTLLVRRELQGKRTFTKDRQDYSPVNNDPKDSFKNENFPESCLEEEEVIVFEQETEELLGRVIPITCRKHSLPYFTMKASRTVDLDKSIRQVIVVVGEGGSGVTTLARNIYNNVDVRLYFTHCAWLQVSSLFETKDFLISLLKQVNPDELVMEATLSEVELKSRLSELLNDKNKKYLIVIEDLETPPVWLALRDVLRTPNSPENKIIVITRKRWNALMEDAHSVLRVRRLSHEESRKLFVNKARILEDELTEGEKQIPELCGGLHSQIVLLGRLLSLKNRNHDDWSEVIKRAVHNGVNIMDLSYQDLPSDVKPCFLYMLVFPKGFEIPARRLIHLWCAEGFVTSSDTNTAPEDVGEMYIKELAYRNMIQVKWKLDGSPKTCRIANSLYEFFCQKAADVRFLNHQFSDKCSITIPEKSRLASPRFATYFGAEGFTSKSFHHFEHLRSFVAFDRRMRGAAMIETSMLKKIIAKGGLRMVKVLDLEGVYKPRNIHTVLTKLLHLRYLGLRATFIEQLPHSLGVLPFLETLDVKHTHVTDIYTRIWNAKALQHLYLNWINDDDDAVVKYLPPTSVIHLRTLWGLCLRKDFFVENFLRKLARLRNLGLLVSDPISQKSITDWVRSSTQLQSLKLKYVGDDQHTTPSLTFQSKHFEGHKKLQDLYLRGQLQLSEQSKLEVSFFPPNLKTLTLSFSRLSKNPMPVLGDLPNLKILRLFADSYVGKDRLVCVKPNPDKKFPQLRVLKLWKLKMGFLTFEENSMPCLRELEIRSCNHNLFISGLENLTALKEIGFTNMPSRSSYFRHNKDLPIQIKKCRSLSYGGE
ncbi:putative disease resistance RPP13-like protein 3 [Mangifera indica]|uniref:putative disease resistance RPP13-like protein 3 n=1 Tax=Mangifera indica TaxID=29780 RepID=UPI001CFC31EB|nr:putative disease resistance RPP13-like protein 3 [Mangifera indica]